MQGLTRTAGYARRNVRGTLLGHFIDNEGGHSEVPLYAYYLSVVGVQSTESFDPSPLTQHGGNNQAGGGRGMVDLAEYALGR